MYQVGCSGIRSFTYESNTDQHRKGVDPMWDTLTIERPILTHDLPCLRCGHAVHTFLACSDSCSCAPCVMPGNA